MAINTKFIFFTLTLLLALGYVQSKGFEYTKDDLKNEDSLMKLYQRWKAHHNKAAASPAETKKRFNVFKANLRHVEDVNSQKKSYTLHLNQYADLTHHEFRINYAGSNTRHNRMLLGPRANTTFKYAPNKDLPECVDWRKHNAVTPAVGQGACASCWAFGAAAAIESAHAIATGELIKLSEQQLVDCNKEFNGGCKGGVFDYAFKYVIETGLTTDANYPYIAADGQCCQAKVAQPAVYISGYENVPMDDEAALLKAVAKQPVAIALDIKEDFQLYKEGVFCGFCERSYNHGVLIVGYGATPEGQKYWILKNSWGAEWGEEGYMRLERGTNGNAGICGITLEATYPLKEGSGNWDDHLYPDEKQEL